jgi:anti-anti-sigma factor
VPLVFAVELLGDVLRVTFRDDLDMSRAHEVGKALQHAAEFEERPILIALDASVHYIDSFTLSEFLLLRRRFPTRRIAMHVANANIHRILNITDVAKRLNASMSEEEALNALNP